jgi:hypothetical protein
MQPSMDERWSPGRYQHNLEHVVVRQGFGPTVDVASVPLGEAGDAGRCGPRGCGR